ncbi:hypothetical protein [Pontibacter actiniarum]|uniref:Outer membrane protein beta-barrel domain-containing protein n=1 Tax=Pontibacter actiniarum TaxID=323450 RepID=A0A1X9YMA5_9BACT|nr:hypothetical protein [Pontibacter actiniarum]ARS34005.1 hypothetical protein CA264_00320 [Pontibacter actiniarum]
MKQLILLLTFTLLSTYGFCQGKYFFGAGAGAVFTTDNGLPAKAGASFSNKAGVVFPAQLGVYISEKSRVRLELTSMKLRSELDYGYSTLHPDPLIPSQTEVTVKAQGVHLNYDHRVAGTGKLEVFAAAGARALFASSKKEETTYGDGRSEKTSLLVRDYCQNVFGVGAGAVAKYNHTPHLAITLTPDYMYYFGSFNKGGGKHLQLLQLSLGVECRL